MFLKSTEKCRIYKDDMFIVWGLRPKKSWGISSTKVAPKPFPDASAKRVLTMERLSGVPLTDLDAIKLGPQAMTRSMMLNGCWLQDIKVCFAILYIGSSPLLELHTISYDGVGGWGGMLTFMWTCRSSWCYAHAGWGGGGWGGMLTFMWTCRSSWCYAHAVWGGGDGVGC